MKQNVGIKSKSPLTLFKSFNGFSSYSLDEMHLWGSNVSKHLWSMVDDNSTKFGINNPLFLKTKYKELLGKYMERSRSKNPTNATTGKLKGNKSNLLCLMQ